MSSRPPTGWRLKGSATVGMSGVTMMPDGLPPYPATARQTIIQMQLVELRPGASVHAKVDPGNPSAVWLDLNRIS